MPRSRWTSDLHWVRTGQQSRSQRTQESLLDAAAALLAEKGAEATSVADVAERAGCSVGSVYHHFRDKQTLLYAVFDRMSEEFRATTREAVDPARWEGASIPDLLRDYLEFSLELGRERPAFKRAGLELSRGDPALREHFAELRSELYEGLTALLLARREEIGHPDPPLAVGFVLDQLGSMLQTRLDETSMPTRLAHRPDEGFVREALRSAFAYLELDPTHPDLRYQPTSGRETDPHGISTAGPNRSAGQPDLPRNDDVRRQDRRGGVRPHHRPRPRAGRQLRGHGRRLRGQRE